MYRLTVGIHTLSATFVMFLTDVTGYQIHSACTTACMYIYIYNLFSVPFVHMA